MQRAQRITIPITRDMVTQADENLVYQREVIGRRDSTRLDSAENDFVGDLAHHAVEVWLEGQVPYASSRLVRLPREESDEFDIQVGDMYLDVKGTRMPDDHFYVYAHHANNPDKKTTHLAFVQVSRDTAFARVYSVIPLADFHKKARLFRRGTNGFKHPNFGIALFQLPPGGKWLKGVQKSGLQVA